MGESEVSLEAIRARIDSLDRQIQEAVSQRAALAQEVARAKRESGDDTDFYRPEREAEVLRRVIERNRGPLDDEEMAHIFRTIMSACLALQKPLSIAFLGPPGTFTQAAALKHFGHAVRTLAMEAIDPVFREVESGSADYGVVPVENSTEGVVSHTLDMFMHSPLKICGEVWLRIHHCLLSRAAGLDEVRRVYSHQQSLAQCRKWLDAHLPKVELVPVSSNAEAARRVSEGATSDAAIAGEVAASLHGLPVLASNIEDEPENTTRFLIIGRRSVPATGEDKTSLLVSARNRPGALAGLLRPFAENRISMTRIESRPSRRENWDYVFFVDIEGHVADEPVARSLQAMQEHASLLKVLGSYPRAVL